jgi:hypothetical protein
MASPPETCREAINSPSGRYQSAVVGALATTGGRAVAEPALATGSRECAPDDKLRDMVSAVISPLTFGYRPIEPAYHFADAGYDATKLLG